MKLGIGAAPLWNEEQMNFSGLISYSDYINILRNCYKKASQNKLNLIQQLKKSVFEWKNILKKNQQEIIFCLPDDSIYEVAQLLIKFNIHRVPVFDIQNNTCLSLITFSQILK